MKENNIKKSLWRTLMQTIFNTAAPINQPAASTPTTASIATTITPLTTMATTGITPYPHNTAIVYNTGISLGSQAGTVYNSTSTAYTGYNYNPTTYIPLLITSSNNKEIVRINDDGSVTWNSGTNEDEAIKSLSNVFTISYEKASGITEGTKRRMRDSVFEELISIAKDSGALSAEDLEYILRCSKIVEKLKGVV